MLHQHRNVFLSLQGREIGYRGRIRQNNLPNFAEEIAATSSTDNKACNLPGSPRCTFLVTFSYDHKLVASSHGNHTINISRLATGEHVQTLTGHPRSPWCVTFHPSSSEILASGCLGGEVRVWDLQGSSEVWQSENHSMIASLSFHPRDQVLAIATNDQILLWDWRQPVPFASVSISSPLEKVRLVRFSPLGHNLLTGIANAPTDEEEPEYENLDVQHEAYQNATRHSRHSLAEHLSPYPIPPRIDPSLQVPFTATLPPSQEPSLSQQPRRPLSPVENQTLEEAREYAAAVTLTALGLRRVNPSSSLSRGVSYEGWQSGQQIPPSEQLHVQGSGYPRSAQHQRIGSGNIGSHSDPDRVRGQDAEEISGRSGISWNRSEEASSDIRSSDDAGSGEDWLSADSSTENSQSTSDRMLHFATEEARSYAAAEYVNMDVSNGDEIRVARTSVSIPQTHSSESRNQGLPHVARLQQLPTDLEMRTHGKQNTASAVNAPAATSFENDQGCMVPGEEMRPLDLASTSRCVNVSSTSSQERQDAHQCETQDVSLSLAERKDCHSPEAKRHCPDVSGQKQAHEETKPNQHSTNQSHCGQSSSTASEISTNAGHATRQRLSFSDAEVSSAVQDMGSSTRTETVLPSQLPSTLSSKGKRPQNTELSGAKRPSTPGAAHSGAGREAEIAAVVSADSESQMQPALHLQTLSHPQVAVLRRNDIGVTDPPRAFTAHLGTIPHTAPPDSPPPSDNGTSRSNPPAPSGPSPSADSSSHLLSSASSHFASRSSRPVRSTSQLSSTSRLDTPSPSVLSTLSVTNTSRSPPSVYLPRGSASHSIPPQSGTGFGPQRGMRALHFGTVDSLGRIPVTTGPHLDPLDLSVARTGRPSQSEIRDNSRDIPQPERTLEPPGNDTQQVSHREAPGSVPSQVASESSSQSETGRRVSFPSADYQLCSFDQIQDTRPRHQTESQQNPQGIDLSINSTSPGTRPSSGPTSTLPPADVTRQPSYIPGPYTSRQQAAGAPHPPGPIPDSLATIQPPIAYSQSDTASRYRRYNLWRSPGLHRQRAGGLPQSMDPQENEALEADNQAAQSGAGVVYGARRVAPLHTRRHLHVALLNQPSRQMTDVERMDMAARVQRRLLRQSRQGPLRAQLGRLSGQFSGHHHPRNSIFDETFQPPPPMIHNTINRAIASAFAGRGEAAVANNIGNTTYRLQWWDFSEFELPDISDADHNVIVPHCKLHNDASCDISQDGRHLAAFVPSPLGFPDDGVLAIYSLMPHNFGDVLYTKSFGPNAITVSISPLGGFVVVGLASRKLHLHMASKQLIGMIYKLHKEGAAEDSLLHVCNIDHTCSDTERRHHVSVNTVKWIPRPGGGLVYGTNQGDLRICSPSNFTAPDDPSTDHSYRADYSSTDDCPRHDLVHRRRSYTYMYQELGLRGLGLHPPSSSSSSSSTSASAGVRAPVPERRARGTQTPQRALFSTATQTDEHGSP